MSLVDIVLLLIIAAVLVGAFISCIRHKNKCSCGCGNCTLCKSTDKNKS